MKKKLRKSKKDRIISGVIGGAAEYLAMDPTVARIIWLIGLAFTGFVPGIALYIVAAVVLPNGRN
jgi:phage shock protein PspC (stress-responsive transcriptional regulator)